MTPGPASSVSVTAASSKQAQTLPTNFQAVPTHPAKRISTRNIEGLAKRLATNALVSHTGKYVQKVTKRTIDTEQQRRADLQKRLKLERRTRVENQLSESLLNRLVEGIVREEVADAYGEEMWELPLRQKAFSWWRTRARTKRALRHRDMQRSVTRSEFGHRVKALSVSALGSQMNNGEARGMPSEVWPADDVDQDIASSLRKASWSNPYFFTAKILTD